MDNVLFVFIFFFVQIIVLYFVSHWVIQESFQFLHSIWRKKSITYALLALIFLPGTALHELSHFFVATILFLPVMEVRIWPQWRGNEFRLGSVTYQKADIIRSIIIGVAPFIGACFFYWFLGAFHIFPSSHMVLNITVGYLLFVVSANMFSSKQDLIDVGYLIPLVCMGAVLYYLIDIPVHIEFPSFWINIIVSILNSINFYITIALGIHFSLLILFKSLRSFHKI